MSDFNSLIYTAHLLLTRLRLLSNFQRAGIPQIVLPCWLDTYDFAERVEFLGIGIHGSRGRSPLVDAKQLGRAFLEVVMNKRGKAMAQKAKKLAEIVASYGGREAAAEKILELCESTKYIGCHQT
jgi:UDP:flavonoid glycosyltransferase YjiC (YdhE family)